MWHGGEGLHPRIDPVQVGRVVERGQLTGYLNLPTHLLTASYKVHVALIATIYLET